MTHNDTSFFRAIPPIRDIAQLVDSAHYYDVPSDWLIALTDVRGSTQALEDGRYKEVNGVAAASITGLLNVMGDIDVPFVFGGDGATILLPPEVETSARRTLAAARHMAREQFALELRVAVIPVRDVLKAGYSVRVARLEMGPNYAQGIFSGGGLGYAESLLKDDNAGARYAIPDDTPHEGDFSGLECRWRLVPGTHEEVISLIVLALPDSYDAQNAVYRDVLAQIESIYGDQGTRHPILPQNLRLTFSPQNLSVEARVRHGERGPLRMLKMLWQSFKAWLAMRYDIGQWGQYRPNFVEATDHEKFDDALRMTISGTRIQRGRLKAYLDWQRREGNLVFGLTASSSSLVTCIIFDYFGRQTHLVDGASGGYTIAAREMKAQLAELGQVTG